MQKHIRTIISAAIILLFISQPLGTFKISLLERLENFTYDARLKYTAPYTQDKNIVILDIDEKSLGEIGHWPWSRTILAKMVDVLFDYYHINAVGFDIVFAEADTDPGFKIFDDMAKNALKNDGEFNRAYSRIKPQLERDRIFADSLANRKTILGFTFINEIDKAKNVLPKPVIQIPDELKNRLPLNEQKSYTGNLKILQDHALSAGFVDNPSIVYDEDGVFRRVPLLQMINGEIYESLAFSLFRAAIGSPPLELQVEASDEDEVFLDWIKVGDYQIPVDQETNVLVPYRGYLNSFPYVSITDVLNKRAEIKTLKDAIVLVGTSAAGLKDLRTTPLETGYPGVEVHANIVSGILEDRIKEQPDYTYALEFLLLLGLGITFTIVLPRLSPLGTSLVVVSTLFILITGNLYAWNSLNMVFPLANSLLLVIMLFGLHMSYGFFVESRSKRQITKMFGQYVPPELVDELSEHPEALSLEGENRDMSVLFSDVRSFTTISENLDPKELTQLINGFLTPMTHIIHQYRGTIDKYMGDAIMAFWGAPLKDENHARNALLAGMEMIQAMKQLSIEFKARNWPEIRVGVGVNSGNMNVGNMGSEFRMAYTVMGDTVNLGSRLEGLTKNYGVDIIVSDYTREAVPEFEYRMLDNVKVKGKDQPVTIFEPLGPKEDVNAETRRELDRYGHALEHYLNQNWDKAEKALFELHQEFPDRKLYEIYLGRIAIYRQEPPGDSWDGVFTHKTK